MSLARWFQALWFPEAGKHRNFSIAVFFFWPFLWGLQWLFVALVGLRQVLFRWGLIKEGRLPVPVVVIGNLTVGGAGKTPLTLWLAEQLIIRGIKPGIISRGYGGSGVSSGQAIPVFPQSNPAVTGDEPVLLAMRSVCPVWVSPRRVEAAQCLLAEHPETQILLCDDGLQHWALARDVEIAVFDQRGFGNGWRLPLGPLREPLSRLATVDAVVLNGVGELENPLRQRLNTQHPQLPVFDMTLHPGTFYRLGSPQEHCTAADLRALVRGSGRSLHAVAGIGHPERFFATLRQLGLTFKEHPFADHHHYQPEELAFPGSAVLLLTEKDAVKCASFYRGEAWVLPVEAHISSALADILMEKIHGRTSA